MPPVILAVPHIPQRQQGECLAACAAMVLTYLGLSVTYDQLLQLLRVNWFGTPASNIRELENLGLTVFYQQGILADITGHLSNNRPCIAFLQTGELPYWDEAIDHAVVVVGMDEQSIFLNDPAFPNAPIQVSQGDFDLAWLERDEFYATFTPQE
jgi:ABC-type bacteriocin/lantibiotic exporter with double-glycine peptidase domain